MKRTCIALPSREEIKQVNYLLYQVTAYGKLELELNFAESGSNPVRATKCLGLVLFNTLESLFPTVNAAAGLPQ